ncbi:restriction endonuclease subunit S [Burkholderia anthina]|nr:restriction endonuclease subunit S [Burkholderia anthina]
MAIGPFGSRLKTDAYTKSGVALIRGQNLIDSKALSGEFVFVSDETARNLGNANVKPFDLVFPHRGNIGSVGIVPEGAQKYALSTSLMKITLDRKKVEPLFLYYFFRSSQGRAELLKNASQVGTPGIATPLTSLRACVVPVPPVAEQAAIAQFLSLLDDSIDLLRQTSATRESIAQALFKSWFIDFDPVRAKAEGREPEGMDAETAALFPDSFEDSALGEIPKRWTVSEVGRVTQCVGGGTPSTKDEKFWKPAIHHWTTPKDLSGIAAPVLLNTERKLSDAGLAKVSSGLLPAGTLLMSSRAPIGYLAISAIEVAVNQGYIAMPPGGTLPPVYLYFWCQANMNAIKQKANGSTFMEISKTAFRPIPLILPPATVVSRFTELAENLFASITEGERQALQLSQIRDTLLPRLISGQIRLTEAEAQLNEALA